MKNQVVEERRSFHTEQRLENHQVTGTADRKKLRQTLNQAE